GFLHRTFATAGRRGVDPDQAPVLQLQETDFGFEYGGRRRTQDGQYYWRVTPFVLPTFTSIPNPGEWDGTGFFIITMDDNHTWWFTVSPPGYRGAAGAPGHEHVELIPGTFRQTANKDNDYNIDREMQRTVNYTGLL